MSKLLIRFVMKSSFLAKPALARRTREEERRRRRGREDWSGRRRRPSTRRPALEPSPGSTWLLSLSLSELSRVGKRAESAAAVASWFIAPPLGRGRGRGGVGVTCYVVDAPLVHATKVWGGHLGLGGMPQGLAYDECSRVVYTVPSGVKPNKAEMCRRQRTKDCCWVAATALHAPRLWSTAWSPGPLSLSNGQWQLPTVVTIK